MTLMPEVIAKSPNGYIADRDASKVLRNSVYGYQHNNVFNTDLGHWIKKITDIDIAIDGCGSFRILKSPVCAGLVQKGRAPLPESMQRFAKQSGLIVTDASLLFSSASGHVEVKCPSPLKGLLENRPWDYQLTSSGLCPAIDVAAICPIDDSAKLKRFLGQLNERAQPKE